MLIGSENDYFYIKKIGKNESQRSRKSTCTNNFLITFDNKKNMITPPKSGHILKYYICILKIFILIGLFTYHFFFVSKGYLITTLKHYDCPYNVMIIIFNILYIFTIHFYNNFEMFYKYFRYKFMISQCFL